MLRNETKRIFFSLLILLSVLFILPKNSSATDYSSSNFTVKDPVIDSGFETSNSTNFGLGQSLSQIAIGKSTSTNFQIWSGFQYYFKVNQNTLTATPADAEVDLLWTVPTSFLGVEVGSYEVGTGTISGTYVFENVGNVTTFTKTGLTNSVPYFFIVKALAPGGTFLVYSNEATATPTAAVAPPGGGGGGVPGTYTGSITISGTAYPNSPVTILRDSVIVSTQPADSSGFFSINLSGMSSGTYSFGVYATDTNGIKSPTVGFERTISNSVTTTVSQVIVAPTIRENFVAVKKGETITFSGFTGPNAPLTFTFTGAKNFSGAANSNSSGAYNYVLNTSALPKGSYSVYVSSMIGTVKSPNSFVLSFTIGDSNVEAPADGCGRSDLNCDGKVDLIDFSILLYFWDLQDFSRNPRVDIDKNGSVGLRDLSIMLYDWTG
jgi:hypothetical protein